MGQAFLMNQKRLSNDKYQRPKKWLPIPAFDSNKDEIYILMAVYETDFNPIALKMQGDYSVDWGDGSAVEAFSSNTIAEHIFDWEDIPSATYFEDRGYRQALIRVYGDRSTIYYIDFNVRHSAVSSNSISSTILEINGNVNSYWGLVFPGWSANVSHNELEIISMRGSFAGTYMGGIFNGLKSLQYIPYLDTHNVTNMQGMFGNCSSLRFAPSLDTGNVTNMNTMFAFCSSLQEVPAYDTSDVTDTNGMFNGCSLLSSVPIMDTSKVTDMQNMFYGCQNLQSIPLLDTIAVTNMSGAFYSCLSLRNLNFVLNSQKISFDISNCQLSALELNEIFNQLADVTASPQTVTVTGNPGAATCDVTIATNKGWTVVT